MKNILKYTAIAAFALTALSCAKTAEEDFAPAGDPIQFSGSIGNFTKAGDTYFDEGDKIGLYASEPLNLYDVALVAGGNGFLKPEKTIYWTPDAGVVSFTAYYPYGALAPGRKTYFEVYENQSSYGYYTASDVMGALTEAEYPATEVSFTFAHLLSKLSLKIDNIVGKEIASVVLRPVDISANISLEEDVVENAGKYYSEIRLCPVTLADGSDAWICIVPPQTISPTLVVNTTDGLSYTFEVNGEISFTRGCRTDAYVKLDGTSTILNIESIVEDWGWDGEVEFKNPYDDNPSDLPSHTGVRIYVQDQTNWNNLYLYQWGDVNNFGGDWPGLAVSGTVAMNGAEYKYFDYSDAVIGLNQNLIFNDGNGSQLADYSMTFERGVSDYFFIITPNGAMRIDDEPQPAEGPVYLYVYADEFFEPGPLSFRYAGDANNWNWTEAEVDPEASRMLSVDEEHSYYVYDFSAYAGYDICLFFWDEVRQQESCNLYITLRPGSDWYLARSPASFGTVGDPTLPIETAEFPAVWVDNISMFSAYPAHDKQFYVIEGDITSIDNPTYGNIYIADATGSTLYVYGLTASRSWGYNDRSFSTLGLREGHHVWVSGTRADFNGTVEMKWGYLVNFIKDDTEYEWSLIGTICGTCWDTDIPMAWSDGLYAFYVTIPYNEGELFKIRADGKWDHNYGGGEWTGSALELVINEKGAAFADVAENGADITVKVSDYPSYSGSITVLFMPGQRVIAVYDSAAIEIDDTVEPLYPDSLQPVCDSEDNTPVEIDCAFVYATSTRGFVVSDGKYSVLVYTGSAPTVQPGDYVRISATKTTYKDAVELTKVSYTKIRSMVEADEIPELYPEDITESIDNFYASFAMPVSVTGTLVKSGNYYNLQVEGATRMAGIDNPVSDLSLDELVGQKIVVEGFYLYITSSGGQEYLQIMAGYVGLAE